MPTSASVDSMVANARYNRAIIPLLLKHGGLPVFESLVQRQFIHPPGSEDWDRLAMVRYRSRRDMLKMAVEIAGNDIDLHKWAAREKTQVFPVKPLVSLIFVRGFVAVVLSVAGVMVYLLVSGLR